ncbi:hypothetical protein EZS27_040751, partial [termite gut metagenome]
SDAQIAKIEEKVNEVINRNLPVTISLVTRDKVPPGIDLSKLPTNTGDAG